TNKGVYSPYTWQAQVMQAFEENKHALDVTLEELERITEKQKKEGLNTDSLPIHSPNPLPLDEDETVASPPERTGSRKEAA
ncbi:hypothetical protein VSS86_22615, partial [Bacillus safensis]|nr:hypothetical protein [Bacillus safensis]